MGLLTEANFTLTKFKHLSTGVVASWDENIIIDKDVATVAQTDKKIKDDPHADLKKALAAFSKIVMYDEGYDESVDIEITGVQTFKKGEEIMITHLKGIESGRTSRNSGKIHSKSEEFAEVKKAFELLQKLSHEVYLYFFKNKRPQLTMFSGNDGGDQKAA